MICNPLSIVTLVYKSHTAALHERIHLSGLSTDCFVSYLQLLHDGSLQECRVQRSLLSFKFLITTRGARVSGPLCFTVRHSDMDRTHPDLHLHHHCRPAFQHASDLASSAGAPCETPSACPSCLPAHLLLVQLAPGHHLHSKCTQAS